MAVREVYPKTVITFNNCMRSTNNLNLVPKHIMTSLMESACLITDISKMHNNRTAGKGLTSWLSFVVSSVSLSLSHWYPGSGVVLDCIDS